MCLMANGPTISATSATIVASGTPTENLNVGRTFRIKEKVTLNVRVEMTNAFNRTQLPQPNAARYFRDENHDSQPSGP